MNETAPHPHRIAGYEVLRPLHRGEATLIYAARRLSDGTGVTLKLPAAAHPTLEQVARLRHEFELGRDLDVPGLVRPVAFEQVDGRPLLVLEEFVGDVLFEAVRDAPMSAAAFLAVAIQLAETLGRLHRAGVIHKDVKPQNILWNAETGIARLTDLGVASRLARERRESDAPLRMEGTLAYMAPEQSGRIDRDLDERADLYALGATFQELLTGRPPFPETDPLELLHAHVARRPPPVHAARPDLPRVLSDIVAKLLAKDPDERYASAFGLAADLERAREALRAGRDAPFALGRGDVAERPSFTGRLVGRDAELRTLKLAVERAAGGTFGLAGLVGAPGAGKSALAAALSEPATRAGGRLLRGRHERMAPNAPHASLAAAFGAALDGILTLDEPELDAWRTRLSAALGERAAALAGPLPPLAAILGEAEEDGEAPPLGPAEARARADLAWEALIGAFVEESGPLVLVLDDMQWADPATLGLVRHLALTARPARVLLVLAWREDEVDAAHPLSALLDDVRAGGAATETIPVGPLDESALARWIDEALGGRAPQRDALAAIVREKTRGNPFHAAEMLAGLHRDGRLSFDREAGAWICDLEAAAALDVAENVVGPLIARIDELPPGPAGLLRRAACIGTAFDLGALIRVEGRPPAECLADVLELVRLGFLRPTTDFGLSLIRERAEAGEGGDDLGRCRFQHDRVREAAYASMPEEARLATHLALGRPLLDAPQTPAEPDFAAVDHLDLAFDLIDPAGRARLAEIDLRAGRRARRAAAFDAARHYFSAGLAALATAEAEPELARALSIELRLGLAEAEHLLADAGKADRLCAEVLADARTDDERLRVHALRITLLTGLERHGEALDVGVEASRLLGAPLARRPGQLGVARQVVAARLRLRGRGPAEIAELPPMTDPQALARQRLYASLIAPAFLSDPDFAITVALRSFNDTLRGGLSRESPFGVMVFAVANAALGRYAEAARWGALALDLDLRIGEPRRSPMLRFVHATAIGHWRDHARENLDRFAQAFEGALAAGDLVYADYALVTWASDGLFIGEPLERVAPRCARHREFLAKRKRLGPLETSQGVSSTLMARTVACLRGESDSPSDLSGDGITEADIVAALSDDLARFGHATLKMQLRLIFDDLEEDPPEAAAGAAVIPAVKVMADIRLSEYFLYDGLIAARLHDRAETAVARRRLRRRVARDLAALAPFAEAAPVNYGHRRALLAAEAARLDGRDREAIDLYESAIADAAATGYLQVEALAHELAGRHALDRGWRRIAAMRLADARRAYAAWGATAKVERLIAEHGDVLSAAEETAPASSLATTLSLSRSGGFVDAEAAMKAADAISGEIRLDALLAKLLRILMENAGADRGALLLRREGDFRVEAEARIDHETGEESLGVLQGVPAAESGAMPLSILNRVVRTRSPWLSRDAQLDPATAGDPYVVERRPRSLLAVPLVAQGEVISVAYLENSLGPRAFTERTADFARLIAGQASTSLRNAMLYESQATLARSADRFVPHAFLELMGRKGLEEVALGEGVQRDMTIMFVDIRGFTAMSESRTPRETFEFVNDFLQRIGPAIRARGGFVGKYLGDGAMAFFPDSCDDAAAAASDILGSLAAPFGTSLGTGPLRIGIGLNVGSVLMGVMGEAERLQCDAISDAANVAARLETVAGERGIGCVASASLVEALSPERRARTRPLGLARLEGRRAPIRIYEVVPDDGSDESRAKLAARDALAAALEHFEARRFGEANAGFVEAARLAPADPVARAGLRAAAACLADPPGPDWSGALTERGRAPRIDAVV